jgi:hypothetical protein
MTGIAMPTAYPRMTLLTIPPALVPMAASTVASVAGAFTWAVAPSRPEAMVGLIVAVTSFVLAISTFGGAVALPTLRIWIEQRRLAEIRHDLAGKLGAAMLRIEALTLDLARTDATAIRNRTLIDQGAAKSSREHADNRALIDLHRADSGPMPVIVLVDVDVDKGGTPKGPAPVADAPDHAPDRP